MTNIRLLLLPLLALLMGLVFTTHSQTQAQTQQFRFPPPDFGPQYTLPTATTPPPPSYIYEYLDLAVFIAVLCLAGFLTLKKRSRLLIFLLMIFSLMYFGFWRKGCICSIGSLQNVALAIIDQSYAIPIVVLLFFALPLVFTLLFGRAFCAALCPLGAIQDAFIVHPLVIPGWLQQMLGLLAYVYLALALLFAATGSAFILCQYDPFISLLRRSGSINMLILGSSFLLLGMFIARPYCRFLCPYGVLLRWMSRLSRWRVTITPDRCVQCRLCENVCPFGAIEKPTPPTSYIPKTYDRIRLIFLIFLLPILTLTGGFLISRLSTPLSRVHPTVQLAESIYLVETGQVKENTDPVNAFRATGKTNLELYTQASQIQKRFVTGTWLVGLFLGLVFGGKLIQLSLYRRRTDYTANQALCLACGRCFAYCPVQKNQAKLANNTITIKV